MNWGDNVDRAIAFLMVFLFAAGVMVTVVILGISNYLGNHLILGWKP